jgi:hypothetical protein
MRSCSGGSGASGGCSRETGRGGAGCVGWSDRGAQGGFESTRARSEAGGSLDPLDSGDRRAAPRKRHLGGDAAGDTPLALETSPKASNGLPPPAANNGAPLSVWGAACLPRTGATSARTGSALRARLQALPASLHVSHRVGQRSATSQWKQGTRLSAAGGGSPRQALGKASRARGVSPAASPPRWRLRGAALRSPVSSGSRLYPACSRAQGFWKTRPNVRPNIPALNAFPAPPPRAATGGRRSRCPCRRRCRP